MDITRSSLLSTMLYSALLLVLFWWGDATPSFYVPPIDTSIFGASWDVISPVFGNNATIERLLSVFLMFVISLQVARLAIRNVIFLERTYMPSVVFVIVSAAFYNIEYSFVPIVATFFMSLAFSQGLRSYPVKTLASRRILSCGVYLGLAAFVYPPATYFTPYILVVLSMFRIGDLKEWIVGVVGVLLPLATYFFVLWVMQRNVEFAAQQYYYALILNDGTTSSLFAQPLNLIQYTFIATLSVLFVLSLIRFARNVKAYKRRSALGFGFFIIVALWTCVVMFASPARSLYMLPILGLGLSIIIPTYFAANKPSFWTNFLYALLLLSAITIHFIN